MEEIPVSSDEPPREQDLSGDDDADNLDNVLIQVDTILENKVR